jgi:uncharacterized protein DUF1835
MSALHVTNGDSAAQALRAAGVDALPWRDALHEGPVRAVGVAELRAERAAFLESAGFGPATAIAAEIAARDEALARATAVVLWFEHDLYDQLQLVEVLTRLRPEVDARLVLTDDYLSSLEPEELLGLAVVPAGRAIRGAAARFWAAFTAPEPTGLLAVEGLDELPHLRAARDRLLEELPAPGDGLTRSERAALRAISVDTRDDAGLMAAVAAQEEAIFLGDTWLFRRLEGLAVRDDGGWALTPAGSAVLTGVDRVGLVALDRWLGGTRLRDDAVWRYDPVARALTSSAGAR